MPRDSELSETKMATVAHKFMHRQIQATASGIRPSDCYHARGGSKNLQNGGRSLPFPSSPLKLSSYSPPFLSFLELVPLTPGRGYGERCKLPQWGPGGTHAENEFGGL